MTNANMGGAALPDPRKAASWFIIEGVLLTTFGIVAAGLPTLAGMAAALVFGWLLILSGLLGLVAMFAARGHSHPVWTAVSALAALVAGLVVIWHPVAGILSLALLIALYLLIDAWASTALALDRRRQAAGGWGWLILTGVIDLVLAAVIIFMRPHADAVFLGFIVAVDLIIGGVSLFGLGLAVRRAA